jgi:hypothetical protein
MTSCLISPNMQAHLENVIVSKTSDKIVPIQDICYNSCCYVYDNFIKQNLLLCSIIITICLILMYRYIKHSQKNKNNNNI